MESTLKISKVKVLSTLLSVIFIIGMFTGCGNNLNSQSANSSLSVDTASQSSSEQATATITTPTTTPNLKATATKYPLTLPSILDL